MSFFKSMKKWMLPGIGGKILGNKLFKDKKKPGVVDTSETPEQVQARYEQELHDYGDIDSSSQQGAVDRAKAAGTYAPTTAFKEQSQAEAGAAGRQLKGAAEARIAALKKRYYEMTNK